MLCPDSLRKSNQVISSQCACAAQDMCKQLLVPVARHRLFPRLVSKLAAASADIDLVQSRQDESFRAGLTKLNKLEIKIFAKLNMN